jgi:hypothetical protein
MIRIPIFTNGLKDKKEKEAKLVADDGPMLGPTKDASPDTAKVVVDSDTEPPTSESDTSIENVELQPSCSARSKASMSSPRRRKKTSSVRSSKSRKRVKRIQAGDGSEKPPTPEPELGSEMMILAEAMHLELNTQSMLASYDARTLEDFCFMADVDFNDLVAKARSMNRALPPLQIRKVQVLRDWVKGLIDTKDDDSNLPLWARKSPSNPRRKATMIPKDWKARFKQDIPKLKQALKAKGEKLTTHPWLNYLLSFRTMFACGH